MQDKDRLKNFIATASALVGYQLTICMPYVICAFLIGRIGSSFSLSSYGLSITIANIGFYCFVMGIQEAIGVVCSKLYGNGQYNTMWKYLWKSLLFVLVITGFFHLFSLFSTQILLAINIDMKIALPSGRLLKLMSMSLYLQGINEIMNNFLSAQNITKPLFYLNLISIAIVYLTGDLFINHLGYAELGYGYMKICQESFHFIYYIFVVIKYTNLDYVEWPSAENIKDDFWPFFKENIYTIMTYYGSVVIFEINTYLAALLHDVDALAIWVAFSNVTIIHYFTSVGLGAAMRNLVGKRIGESRIDLARNESISYLKYMTVFSIFLTILTFICSDGIAGIFTAKYTVTRGLSKNLKFFSICIPWVLILPSTKTLYRVLNQASVMIVLTTLVFPASYLIFSYLFCLYFRFGVEGIVVSGVPITLLKSGVLLLYLYINIDWRKANLKDEMIQHGDMIQDDDDKIFES